MLDEESRRYTVRAHQLMSLLDAHMMAGVRPKLLGVEIAAGLGALDGSNVGSNELAPALGNIDMDEAKRLARRSVVHAYRGSSVGDTRCWSLWSSRR